MTETVIAKMWHAWRCQACNEMNWRDDQQIGKTGAHVDRCEHCGYKHTVVVQGTFDLSGATGVAMYTQDELSDTVFSKYILQSEAIAAKLKLDVDIVLD